MLRHIGFVLIILHGFCATHFGQEPKAFDRLKFHAPPKPLPKGAVIEDWPRFLGPRDDATSKETMLLRDWPEGGPKVVWEMRKGGGYTCPAIRGERLVYFHRLDDEEVVECLHPETGRRYWEFSYPVVYRDRYGFSNGPRASPVIDGDRVYLVGVTARMHCLDLNSGKLIWMRDLKAEYNVPQNFFGYGPTPAVWQDRLIVNVGGKADGEEGVCVAALDKLTGKEIWSLKDRWGASYASPIVTKMHGRDCALVLAGGESRPGRGGLLVIDAKDGRRLARFPWRAKKYESVNASTPIVLGGNRIYISECYEIGGVMLEFDEDFEAKEVWKERWFGMHWMTPVREGDYLYGFAGRNEPDVEFKCFDARNGEKQWNEDLKWQAERRGRSWNYGYFRGSLLKVDGSHLCLGEHGALAWMDLSPEGVKEVKRAQIFYARNAWTLPAISRGLLYVCQNEPDADSRKPPRLICYDLRR